MEQRSVEEVPGTPLHPYTIALRDAALPPDMSARTGLTRIEGEMPSAVSPPSGCHFHPRCAVRLETCLAVYPAWSAVAGGRTVRCHRIG